ncbi:MAG: hypothetical protein LBD35_01045 [Prevotellaceae bacterium]|jgi:hypothetical protein|nr:hypothetical protein [Prevotellaceae bacterium]
MKHSIKLLLLAVAAVATAASCMKKSTSRYYEADIAVIQENYFLQDIGTKMIPSNGWKDTWGQHGDRVFLTYYYDAYDFNSETNSLPIEVDEVAKIQTEYRALPHSSADTVGTASFLLREGEFNTSAWNIPDFLTVQFFFYYSNDSSKSHTFGFVEDDPLFRNDTLNLRFWHKTNETTKTNVVRNFVSLRLDSYKHYLNQSDTAFVSIKYLEENTSGGTVSEKKISAKYYKP